MTGSSTLLYQLQILKVPPESLNSMTLKIYVRAKSNCKNKRVVLTQLGYLSCNFTAKECTYKQIYKLATTSLKFQAERLSQVPRVIVTGSYVARAMLEMPNFQN